MGRFLTWEAEKGIKGIPYEWGFWGSLLISPVPDYHRLM